MKEHHNFNLKLFRKSGIRAFEYNEKNKLDDVPEKLNKPDFYYVTEDTEKTLKLLISKLNRLLIVLDKLKIVIIGSIRRRPYIVSTIEPFKNVIIVLMCNYILLLSSVMICSAQDQGNRPVGTHQDNTDGKEWIRRLERPDRIPGLKIDDVVRCLKLKPGDVVADIGAGTGAYTIPFAKAVAPTGKALGVDIHQDLLDYINTKAKQENLSNLKTILAKIDDPNLPKGQVDLVFFNDVFHNMNDRQAYLELLASYLKPTSRIVIIEQEFDDPIAKKWDRPEDRITREQVKTWMARIGYYLMAEFDIFEGANNPQGTGMPERWFVVYCQGKSFTQ